MPELGVEMLFTRVWGFACHGIEAQPVAVEVDVSAGLPQFDIVGLPDSAVREARDRVRSAIRNSGCEFPSRRITVNLAPADLRKVGGGFDLPMALGILVATGQVEGRLLQGIGAIGELALDGQLRAVPGALAMALAAQHQGIVPLLVPIAAAPEATLAGGRVLAAGSLGEVVAWLRRGELPMAAAAGDVPAVTDAEPSPVGSTTPDLVAVHGQELARRALEIAAAGGHHLLLVGPPGVGKSLLARCLPGVLPPLDPEEALAVTGIHGAAGQWSGGLMRQRPYRAPHHGASRTALLGGGSSPRPGEVTLAHGGVLFLDELPEFSRDVLEGLRQPLEEGLVHLARARWHLTFPARFQLVAAANPCPCGYHGDEHRACTCTAGTVARYQERLSGPLLDRFDLQVRLGIPAVAAADHPGEPSAVVRSRVLAARERQRRRHGGQPHWNAHVDAQRLRAHGEVEPAAEELLRKGMRHLGLSMRAVHRLLRVARTVADLDGDERIGPRQVAEALQYRLETPPPVLPAAATGNSGDRSRKPRRR